MKGRFGSGSARRALAFAALSTLALAGCGTSGPPRIALHSKCASCGMEIADLRFACERATDRGWRQFDAIECLIHDAREHPGGTAWLADYDGRDLHAAESLWIVKGEFPTPMSGGFAAFAAHASAESVAVETRGRVERFATWMERGWP